MFVKYLDSCYVGDPQNETIGRIGIPGLTDQTHTNRSQRISLVTSSTDKHYSLDSEDDFLLKRQSQTTVLFRTTLTRTITQYELLILVALDHFLYDMCITLC